MSNPKMTDEMFDDCFNNWTDASGGNPYWEVLAEKWGFDSKEQIREKFKRERTKRGISKENSIPTKEDAVYKESDDFIHIVYANTTIKTKEDVIREYKIDMTKWKIAFFEVKPSSAYRKDRKVTWEVEDGKVVHGNVQDSGKLIVATLYNLRVKFIPVTLPNLSLDAIQEFYKEKKFVCKIKFPIVKTKSKDILEICVSDWHIGSRLYNKNWNELEKSFPKMMSDIFNKIEGREFKKIYFIPLGDIFHYENRQQKTERSQRVVDSGGMNPLEMFDTASSMIISTIDELLQFAPVEVKYIPGNHDGISLYHLIARLKSYYHAVGHFTADLGHESRKWELIGKNLLAWEHGEMPKKNRLHWLCTDASKDWGKSEYREVHFGHLHHEEVSEYGGVKLRRLSAITSTDFWHYRNGYTGAIRATMSFVWNEDRLGWTEMWQSTCM